jgi:UDP-N-acetyl-D-mannosaminuronic acid transferase (WecB/TagA/CpsF family)
VNAQQACGSRAATRQVPAFCLQPRRCRHRLPHEPRERPGRHRSISPKVTILGVGISTVNMEIGLEQARSMIMTRQKAYICVNGVHGIMKAQRDHSHRATLNSSCLAMH